MLLRQLRTLRFRAAVRDDEGVALAAVVGLMAVMLMISTAVLAATLNATAFSTSTRADVQSQAAADAGVDAAFASIKAGAYVCAVSSTTSPVYSALIAYKNSSGSALTCATTVSGTPATAVVTSTGSASAALRATDGNSATVVANVTLTTSTSTAASTASGPAVYGYAQAPGGFGNSGTVRPYNGSIPDVVIKTGDLSCTGAAAAYVSNLVVAAGKLDVGGSCSIGGNAYAAGALALSGSVAVGGTATGSSVKLDGSSSVGGNVDTAGALVMTGSSRVGATATNTVNAGSANITSTGGVAGSMWIKGNTILSQTRVGKNLTTKSLSNTGSTIGGTTTTTDPSTPGASPYASPTVPAAPAWIDYAYTPSSWPGYTLYTMPAGPCGWPQLNAALNAIGTNNGIIDGRACTGSVDPGLAQQVTIKANLAIIANSFTLAGSSSFAATNAANLWLITPDTSSDGIPTCRSNSSFTLGGSFWFSSTISTFFYTPCTVTLGSSNTLYGQVWAGAASITGAGTLYFVPVGLPGYNLSTGGAAPTVTTTTAALSSRYDLAG